ncbi:Fbox domain containing protein [Acanthamoeba castellanii str. Neff]|uniref:Fbox domain containing protein n=1 Tax=Acanthamoeba castellanii (strain ATCC 30010 / Neff) TaxID=1257118 RepID=L8GVM8_ACACF|nr:Fbox domain containing protein [Acanthamoeba castellanii str. Neff]ELR17002.1 Fbox domain containing protein [Acanthamoeba castellanii str. Neff]
MEQLEVPVELVCHILGYAESLASLGRLRRVCQRWRDLIDSSPSLWARFSELEIEHSRIEPAALHRLCDRIPKTLGVLLPRGVFLHSQLRLVGCSKALHHPITTLLTAPQGSQVKVVHIENCDKITSDDVSLAAIVNNCPLLETLMCVFSSLSALPLPVIDGPWVGSGRALKPVCLALIQIHEQ